MSSPRLPAAAAALRHGPRLETTRTHSGRLVTRVVTPADALPEQRDDVSASPILSVGDAAATGVKVKGRVTANEFQPRASLFDWETMEASKNPMRGFFTLFWMTMAAYLIGSTYDNWRTTGSLVGTKLGVDMFGRGSELLYSELAMIGSLFGVVVITKAFVMLQPMFIKGWIPPRTVLLVQHVYQTTWFAVCMVWVYNRTAWSWVQSGTFTVHAIAMLMKQHSYMSYNIEMLFKHTSVQRFKVRMDQLAAEIKKTNGDEEVIREYNAEWEICKDKAQAQQIELCKGNTTFPDNVSFLNFLDYLVIPSLVYELEYPRTKRIRKAYLLEKAIGTAGIFVLLYVTVEHFIYPVVADLKNLNFAESLAQLLLPFMVSYLLLFYIIFECICNFCAEITRFADRHFYDDWWNCVTFDEYARKWNKPVHEFLLRHVYLESITTYKLSQRNATLLTFFLSSCLHEVVMIVLAKRVRLYLFGLQMLQLPLIFISRWSKLKSYPRIGNAFFWWSIYTGPPMLAVAYCREMMNAT
ncbi:hypothetical protein HKX48_003762 [Thoreauomyces humboldtii]|nr:hypothetical protein HKX48_003762 [Thoreauomyces humboldtii]